MIPEVIRPEWDDLELCAFQDRWMIAAVLADRLHCLAYRLPFGLRIISGFRTLEAQQKLINEGKGAALDRSTHVTCPATGADVWPTVEPAGQIKLELGRVARLCGLRWGGGSAPDENGIPSDWNHLDLGPRAAP